MHRIIPQRYSKNYFDDGFSVHIDINGQISTFTFQSSATVDHVKYEIFKFHKEILKDSNHQDYFLALNKNDLLQIEFVKFIYAHDDIQKSLLTKVSSIEVFLVPKSKEIKARKHRADIIKKQLGSIRSTFTTKGYGNNSSSSSSSNNTNKRQSRHFNQRNQQRRQSINLSNNSMKIQQQQQNEKQPEQKDPTTQQLNEIKNETVPKDIKDITDLNSSTDSITAGQTGGMVESSSFSSSGDLEEERFLRLRERDVKRDTFGNILQSKLILSDDDKEFDSGTSNNEDDKMLAESPGSGDNLSPRGLRKLRVRIDNDMEDDEAERMKLATLQQQLVQIEDEELKYQSQGSDGENRLITDDSDAPNFEDDDDDADVDDDDDDDDDDKAGVTNGVQFALSPPEESILLSPTKPDLSAAASAIDETTSSALKSWSDYVTLREPLSKVRSKQFPVNVSMTTKDINLIIGCPLVSTSTEFKQHLIGAFESMINALKVGTMAIDLGADDIIPINSNSVIHNYVQSDDTNYKIPHLVILKPGMQELINNNNNNLLNISTSPPESSNELSNFNNINKPSNSILIPTLNLNRNANLRQIALSNSAANGAMAGSPMITGSGNKTPLSSSPANGNMLLSRLNNNERTASFSLGEQRDHNVKAQLQRKKLAQIQIGSLLGKPLCWSNGESEIKHFRQTMETVFNFNELDIRERVKVTVAQLTSCSGADPLLPSSFRIKCYLPPDNHSTTININGTDLISEIIDRVISKHNNTTKLLQDQKPSDFIVRITGTSDHVLKDCQVMSLDTVRNRLQRKKDIKFTLVSRSSLPTHIDGFTDDLVNQIPLSRSPPTPAISIQPTTPAAPSTPTSKGSFLLASRNQITKQQVQRSIMLYEINRPFEIRIICLENLNTSLFNHLIPDVSTNDLKLMISVGLYHGEELLTPLLETFNKPYANPLWCEWLRSTLLLCHVPRATKLCFTVYALTDKQRVPVGWVDLQLIDYKSNLQSGVISLILWPGDRTTISEYHQLCPSLVIELSQFPFPVLFPKPELMERTEITDYVEARKQDEERLEVLINKDPMYILTPSDQQFIWTYRMHLRNFPHSLSKVLQSLHWNNPQEVKEAHRLLSIWTPLSPTEALELLDVKFADELVREYAVNCLRSLSDTDLALYLLQLVQSLKHESYHDSALARFLIQRALNNRAVIGHPLFWHLEAEMHNLKISDRYSLILETYLKGCGDQRHEFVKQMEVVTRLQAIAKIIKEAPASKRKQLLQEELTRVSWPNTFHLPTSYNTQSCGIIVNECRWLDSFTTPLLLVFQNVDPMGDPILVIYKHGDDLRQDILTLQMISIMDNLWKRDGLDLHLSIYNVTATGDGMGFIEVVTDSDTVANIQKAAGGATAAFTKTPLLNWLKDRNTEPDMETVVQNFTNSLSGYCVATYTLGISDRHNDNIMVSNSGHLFHIDFAHFLGNIMKFHGYKREKAPFVLTPEFAHVMGGEKSNSFKWFTDLCCLSYNIIRKQRNLFIILFNLMLSTGIPELSTRNDIDYLREAFLMDLDDEEAKQSFKGLIQKSLKTKTTQVMFAFHILAHPNVETS